MRHLYVRIYSPADSLSRQQAKLAEKSFTIPDIFLAFFAPLRDTPDIHGSGAGNCSL
jgi:hypothetical protein